MLRTATIFAAALAALTLRGPSAAADPDWELSAAAGADWVPGTELDAMGSADTLGAFRLGAARRLLALPLGLDLEVDARWEVKGREGTAFQRSLRSSLVVHTFGAGARVRKPLGSALSAFGRFGLFTARGAFEIEGDFNGGRPIGDSDWIAGAGLAGGADLVVKPADQHSPLELGLRAEIGHQQMAAMHFRGLSPVGDDEIGIPMEPVSLGRLDLSGPYIRVGVFGRY